MRIGKLPNIFSCFCLMKNRNAGKIDAKGKPIIFICGGAEVLSKERLKSMK